MADMFWLSLVAGRQRRSVAALAFGSLLWLVHPVAVRADTNTPPTVALQPTNGLAGVGEDFAFSAVAGGTTPFTYQWLFNGANLAGQTNAFLGLTNLTEAQTGTYAVTVSNLAGRIASANALLTVMTNVPRRLGTGRILQAASQVGVPITLRANGRETALAFSLRYNTNAYSNPVFLAARSNAVVNLHLLQPGAVGVTFALPAGTSLPAGNQWLGLMRFDLAAGYGALQGALAFATNPVSISATNTNAQALLISANVQPQYQLVTAAPRLNRQSGLFEQQLVLGNPSASVMTNLDILAPSLGVDSRTNAIIFRNAQATLTNLPFADPLMDVVCDCGCGFSLEGPTNACDFSGYLACGGGTCSINATGTNGSLAYAQINNLLPGESRAVTVEFYVTDHLAIPPPQYLLYLADPLLRAPPPNFTVPLTLTASRFVNGTFLVEFPTRLGYFYYVQYAATPGALATNAQTVFPAVAGTGSQVQWIDNGPPKTDSPPVNGARFYRVLQTQ